MPVGYGHHFKNRVPLHLSSFFNPSFIFIYIKNLRIKKRLYPDNLHAFFIDELKELKKEFNEIQVILTKKKVNTKIKIHGKKSNFKKAIILGGSKGIGKAIALELRKSCKNIHALSTKDIDTSNIESVKKFLKKHKSTDILVLNSGGPMPLKFNKINEKIWLRYFNQLFFWVFV